MKVLIIAPHQDDEILGTGGLIQKCIEAGDIITILFATNGDFQGSEIAQLRYYESCDALSNLGVMEKQIFYLGYGDTGMRYSHSFLRRLLLADMDTPFETPFSSMTYHPANKETVHVMYTGIESVQTKKTFISDMSWIIRKTNPDLLIIPHPKDRHGDHAAIYAFLKYIDAFKHIPICMSYIIHGGDDNKWPPRNTTQFTRPPVISPQIWNKRILIPLTKQQQQKKYYSICSFITQLNTDSNNFLSSFSKQEEVFFLFGNNETIQQDIYIRFLDKEMV